MANYKYLKDNNLFEAHMRFMKAIGESFGYSPLEEADDDQNQQDPNGGGAPGADPMGGGMPGGDPMGGGAPGGGPDPMGGGAPGGDPMSGGAPGGPDGGSEGAAAKPQGGALTP